MSSHPLPTRDRRTRAIEVLVSRGYAPSFLFHQSRDPFFLILFFLLSFFFFASEKSRSIPILLCFDRYRDSILFNSSIFIRSISVRWLGNNSSRCHRLLTGRELEFRIFLISLRTEINILTIDSEKLKSRERSIESRCIVSLNFLRSSISPARSKTFLKARTAHSPWTRYCLRCTVILAHFSLPCCFV